MRFLHGGDYSPEQWINNNDYSQVEKDVLLMKKANINTITLGMFSWACYEPKENEYQFDWLLKVLEIFKANDMKVIIATPSGARPHWFALKYPETSRVNKDNVRNLPGIRHNHCPSSPIMKNKLDDIIERISNIINKFDNIHSWHISNEYGGECYCNLCIERFQKYLENKYQTIDNLNNAWWNRFWSHSYTSFEEILPPFNHGEVSNTSLNINWSEFTSQNLIHTYMDEYNQIRKYSQLPITTNFHGNLFESELDYVEFARKVDYVSYDIYPEWDMHQSNFEVALKSAMSLDIIRCLDKSKDFYIMESSPGSTNWQAYTKIKKDNFHSASTFLQIGCQSYSSLYFQLKQSRGSSEKFHGAVLDINSNDNTRVYHEIKKYGQQLIDIDFLYHAKINSKHAIFVSHKNKLALKYSEGPRNIKMPYSDIVYDFYKALKKYGFNVDFVNEYSNLDLYDNIIFPISYSLEEDMINKIKELDNKKIIFTCLTSYVNNDDLFHLGGFPAHLQDVCGINALEIEALNNEEYLKSNSYQYQYLVETIETNNAKVLEVFKDGYYNNKPAITLNKYQNNDIYYLASIPDYQSIVNFFEKEFNYHQQIEDGLYKSILDVDNQTYEMLINFSDNIIDIKDDYVFKSINNSNKLCKNEVMIRKIK